MPKFGIGENPEQIRSVKWLDANKALAHHIVRIGLGTSESAEYCHAAADLVLGITMEGGTSLNQMTVALAGVKRVRNSLAGTVNIGDPVILDFTNSGGTVGYARSAYTTESLAALGNASDVGTQLATRIPLANKAAPGSFRETGTNSVGVMSLSGTVIFGIGTLGVKPGNMYYTIDQPTIGVALDRATSPRQLFRVAISKERYFKNNILN